MGFERWMMVKWGSIWSWLEGVEKSNNNYAKFTIPNNKKNDYIDEIYSIDIIKNLGT